MLISGPYSIVLLSEEVAFKFILLLDKSGFTFFSFGAFLLYVGPPHEPLSLLKKRKVADLKSHFA